MFFMTRDQVMRWAADLQLNAKELSGEYVDSNKPGTIRVEFSEVALSSYVLAQTIANALGEPPEMCLWITDAGIWPSVENQHLYYKLRGSYGDLRSLSEAPAHRFLGFERADLTSFLQLTLDFRWGGHLISAPSWVVVHISHDGWMVIEAENRLEDIARQFADLDLPVDVRAGPRRQ
jgi:hypothetical protein